MDAKTSLTQPTFLFDDQKRFDAEHEHDRLRSALQPDTDIPPTADVWKKRPVDFTMKNFHPTRKKNRNPSSSSSFSDNLSREKQSQISRISNPVVMQPFTVLHQNIANKHLQTNTDHEENDFQLNPRIKYDKVKRMLNTEEYKNPKLHDFRQYPDIKELGLSEFHTDYDRDPCNIRFLSDHLNTLWLQEREHESIPTVEQPLTDMNRVLTARPKWESRLVLPKLVFPNKYAAYTRYRNPTRSVQSAYWERVEDRFGQRQKKRLDAI